MARPITKADLLNGNAEEYAALEKWLATLTPEQLTLPNVLGGWSVKDTLAHLYEWHRMVLAWYAAGLRGEDPHPPAEGYTWAQLPALNQRIYETYRDRPVEEVLGMFRASYQEVQAFIEGLDAQALFTPGLYPWMNKNMLSAYLNSCCASHYRWARTELRKGLKKRTNV